MTQEIIRQPHPGPQTEMLQRKEREILYGGARGGGKTAAGIARFLYFVHHSDFRGLVLRHTGDDLVARIDEAIQIYGKLGAVEKGKPVQIIFPSGAIIRTGYLKDEKSYNKYKGHNYHAILIEELTQIPSFSLYEKIRGSLRSSNPDIRPQILSTTNPDGVGHKRVKKYFINPTEPQKTYTDTNGSTRVYIPAKVYDNPSLTDNDPEYVKFLEGLKDEQLRRAWLDGDRDAYDVSGGIFISQIKQARKEYRICKLRYDTHLPINTAWDIGIDDYMVVWIFQVVGQQVNILNCLRGSGRSMSYFANRINELGYKLNRSKHFLPHDAKKRDEVEGQDKKKRLSKYLEGEIVVLKRTPSLRDDIENTRKMFPYFTFDSVACEEAVDYLEIYRQRHNSQTDMYGKPIHDASSHFADALRYLTHGVERIRGSQGLPSNIGKMHELRVDI